MRRLSSRQREYLWDSQCRRGERRPTGAPQLWISEVFVKHIVVKVSWSGTTIAVIKCVLDVYRLSGSDDVVGNSAFELSKSAAKNGEALRPDIVVVATTAQNLRSRVPCIICVAVLTRFAVERFEIPLAKRFGERARRAQPFDGGRQTVADH